ncbi:MAG: tRNA pseudouridine(55) synthase TruB [bacterium]
MDGLLLLDKPAGLNSRAVVNAAQRALGRCDLGHAGTLDPQATGLLVLALGSATRWLPYLPGDKTYRATVRLGLATDTEDVWGKETARTEGPVPEPAAFRAALESLTDLREQVVPMVSAVKREGRRLYELAREGVTVERAPRPVRILELRVLDLRGLEADFEVVCGAGTYVRSLCVEAGRRLGLPACMAALRRLGHGGFSVDQALPSEAWSRETLEAALLPADRALTHLPERRLDLAEADDVRHGRPVRQLGLEAGFWRLTLEGRLLALAEAVPALGLRPKRVFAD